MKIRTILFWLPIILALEYCFIASIIYLNEEPISKCGTVIDKKQPTSLDLHKYSADVDVNLLFVVKYDDGIIDRINVTEGTYYNNSIGSRVCFDQPKEQSHYIAFMVIFGGIVAFAKIVGLIIIISELYVKYIYDK